MIDEFRLDDSHESSRKILPSLHHHLRFGFVSLMMMVPNALSHRNVVARLALPLLEGRKALRLPEEE